MKKLLCFIGAAVYSAVFAYLVWLLFYYLTPWLMSFGWFAVILYWIFAFGLIGLLIGNLSAYLFIPMLSMIKTCQSARWIPTIIMMGYAFSAMRLAWTLDIDYSFLKIIIALSLNMTVLIIFFSLIGLLFDPEKFDPPSDEEVIDRNIIIEALPTPMSLAAGDKVMYGDDVVEIDDIDESGVLYARDEDGNFYTLNSADVTPIQKT